MTDPCIDKLASLLVQYSVAVLPGEKVLINGSTLAAPLLKAIYAEVFRAGGHPLLQAAFPDADEVMYRHASDKQLRFIHPPTKLGLETYDVAISVSAAENTKALSGVDPARMVVRGASRRELTDLFMKRSAAGDLRWVTTLYPTSAYAQDAEMSLSDYEDFVWRACLPDMEDPIGYWRRLAAWQEKIVAWLRGRKVIRVTGPDTDLTLRVDDRTFISCEGRRNMPDGEVFTGPVENSVEGTVRFSYPAIYQGREVTNVRLDFVRGRVVKATADKNEAFLQSVLDTDEGARCVGEFAIGTNEGISQFTRQILFDEKIGGSFHLALGAGYPETGSRNVSAIHWDMICDLRHGGAITADDILMYRDGKFILAF